MSDQRSSRPSWFQVVGSVLAAGFGVQSEKNRIRDFQSGSLWRYVVVGVAATLLFVLVLYGIVKWVIATAGA